jgi:hypothetical protein
LIKSFLLEIELFAGRFSESLSDVPLNLNFFVDMGLLCCLFIGLVLLCSHALLFSGWRRFLDALYGEYFNNSRNRPYYHSFNLCRTYWFIGAELGSMRYKNKLMLWVSGTNPFKYLVVTNYGYYFNASYSSFFGDASYALLDRIWLKM